MNEICIEMDKIVKGFQEEMNKNPKVKNTMKFSIKYRKKIELGIVFGKKMRDQHIIESKEIIKAILEEHH